MTNEEAMVLIKKNPISFGCGALSFVLAIGLYLRSEAMPDAEAALIQKTAAGERIALNIKYSAQLKEQLDTLSNAGREIDKRVIRSGVTKDDNVVTNGLAKVRPGMVVAPMPPEKKVAESPAK